MIKTEECELISSTPQEMKESEKTADIQIKRKYNNESLLFIRFLKQKLGIQALYVFIHGNNGFVIVSKKPVVAKNKWNEYVNTKGQFSNFNIQFVKEKEDWVFQDILKILIPQISIQSIEVKENQIQLRIPQNQLKYAIGKNKRHLDLLNAFVKDCTCYSSICFEPQ